MLFEIPTVIIVPESSVGDHGIGGDQLTLARYLSEPEPYDSVIMTGDVGTHSLIYTIRQLITGNNFMLKIGTIEHHSTHVKPRVILVKILLINQNVNTNKKRIIHPEKRENSFI